MVDEITSTYFKGGCNFCFSSKNIFTVESINCSVAAKAVFSYKALSRSELPTRVDKPSLLATPSAVP